MTTEGRAFNRGDEVWASMTLPGRVTITISYPPDQTPDEETVRTLASLALARAEQETGRE